MVPRTDSSRGPIDYKSIALPAKLARQFILRFVNTVKPAKQAFLNMLK